ncbi:MAG: aldehyde dehydrogenase family protein [Pseudomonadota bacterium]
MDAQQTALRSRFDAIRAASRAEPYPDADLRRDRLSRLIAMTETAEPRIVEAIAADFDGRPTTETQLAETLFVVAAARHAKRRVRRWMRKRRQPTALQFWPYRNHVHPQPLGVVGIMAPWNYPYHLAMASLVGALAAGNRAMIKPAEATPATSALIAELVAKHFAPDEVTVVEGGPDVAQAFAALPFDHLVFTGSTRIGRLVAEAAATNLTPVTLELGGKSPAILDRSCDLEATARHIAFGKWFNAGQTCVAPDYVLVNAQILEGTLYQIGVAAKQMYGEAAASPDYASLISDTQAARLAGLLAEAEAAGCRIERPCGPGEGKRFAPAIVVDPPADSALMREEIFGPILPLVPCQDVDEALAHVAAGERPLALYWFGEDAMTERQVLQESWAGGMTVNACMIQLAQEEMPFGGVGASGQGHYHGQWGFDRFSQLKPVTRRGWGPDGAAYLMPPYGKTARRLMRALRWLS